MTNEEIKVSTEYLQATYNEGYMNGLDDAWEAARKIYNLDCRDYEKVFEESKTMDFFDEFTASEAIEKLKAWEQKKDEIHVGDEIIFTDGDIGVVLRTATNEMLDLVMDKQLEPYEVSIRAAGFKKTGRHFPQVEELLKQMQEGE